MGHEAMAPSTSLIAEVQEFLAELRRDLPGIFQVQRPPKGHRRARRIPFQGGHLRVRIEQGCSDGRSAIRSDGDGLVLVRSLDDPRPPYGILEDWYRERAREVLTERARHWSQLIGVRYRRISVKDQRTLWGSCSKSGNLNFNWRLIMAPLAVLDYLVIHELSHLREMNHSKRFWRLVSTCCPDHKTPRRWLREHGMGTKRWKP